MQQRTNLLILPAKSNSEAIIKGIDLPINLTKGDYRDLEFRIRNDTISLLHQGVDINEFDYVWLSSTWATRDLAYGVGLYLEHAGTPHSYVEKTLSKITDQITFALNDIPTPDTFFTANRNISAYVETIEEVCGYPLIIKDTMGSLGQYSVYVTNRDELLAGTAALPIHKKFFYQKYIPNDYDWGIMVSNGKVVSAERSYPEVGEFKNNCYNGATEIFADVAVVPAQIKAMAIKAAAALGLPWSRSDIIVDKITQSPYLMEVNRWPSLSSGTTEVLGAQNHLRSLLQANESLPVEQQLPVIILQR
jgi:glutathione synthase/RimK-type ligase-like ATP-grasp enzyme